LPNLQRKSPSTKGRAADYNRRNYFPNYRKGNLAMSITYNFLDNGIFKIDSKGVETQLTNFTAKITEQIRKHDGDQIDTTLTIEGTIPSKNPADRKLRPIKIKAGDFAAMSWIAKEWGMRPVVMPVTNAERDIRAAIQYTSDPTTVDVYTTTGWHKLPHVKGWSFLHLDGAITANGNNLSVNVTLPPDLARFRFPQADMKKRTTEEKRLAFRHSLNIAALGPGEVTWPLILACYRATLGNADFAIHLSGRTGTFKSEICSLIQSHFGKEMTARALPGSWSSTPNALEALAYFAKDTIFVIDDFVPTGTAWQVRALNKSADQLIRAQGNQAGRARLTDTSRLQQTYFPRGIILSTGEDIPEGHSIRARMMIIEMSPGDVESHDLKEAQTNRPFYELAMADWISWLAAHLDETREKFEASSAAYRDANLNLGHSRTPPMLGDLLATADLLFEYALDNEFISTAEAGQLANSAYEAVKNQSEYQETYLAETDPTDAFCETIRQMLSQSKAHLKTKTGGVPEKSCFCGWTETTAPGEMPSFKSSGPCIGWTDWGTNCLFIDVNALPTIKRFSAGRLSMTKQTLLKRLKDAGIIKRTDTVRQRNTVRVTCEGHPRQVLELDLDTSILPDEEK